MDETPSKPVLTYSSVWLRLAASLVDYIAISLVAGILMFFISMDSDLFYYVVLPFMVIFPWLYFAYQESSAGATIGKNMMGMKVVDIDGNKISFKRATGRYFAKYLSGIFLIGYIMAFFDASKRALHDRLAGTFVVDAMNVAMLDGTDQPEVPVAFQGENPAEVNRGGGDAFGPVPSSVPGSHSATDSFDLKPVSSAHSSEPDTEAKPLPAGAKNCPSCGTVVGMYQTKCHRCSAKLKKGL